MIDVLQCDNCGHNEVCALKQTKACITSAVKNSTQAFDSPDITVAIGCKHFTSKGVSWSFKPKGSLENG